MLAASRRILWDVRKWRVSDYAQDGLALCFDAIENAGPGAHEEPADGTTFALYNHGSVGARTRSAGYHWDFTEAGGPALLCWGGYELGSAYHSLITSAKEWTIEACFTPTAVDQGYSGGPYYADYQVVNTGWTGSSQLYMALTGAVSTPNNQTMPLRPGCRVTIHTRNAYRSASSDYAQGGGAYGVGLTSSCTYSSAKSASHLYLGRSLRTLTSGTHEPVRIHCFRLYSRALSAEERLANWAVDRARFYPDGYKPYDAETEYTCNTGTGQYIDLPVYTGWNDGSLTVATRVWYDAWTAAWHPFFGCYKDGSSNCLRLILGDSSNKAKALVYCNRKGSSGYMSFPAGAWHGVEIVSGVGCTLDGAFYPAGAAGTAYYGWFRLFGTYGNNSVGRPGTRIGRFAVRTPTTVYADLVPVRVGTAGGYYDRVTRKVYLSQGSEPLSPGPDKQ